MNENSKRAYRDFHANMKYKDIAKKYGVSTSTVRSWRFRYWNQWDSEQKEKTLVDTRKFNMNVLLSPNVS